MSTALQKKVVLSTPLPETRNEFEELETDGSVLELEVLWGGHSLLHSDVIDADDSFTVGEGDSVATDFVIGQKVLGSKSLPLVVQHHERPHVLVPRGAKAVVFSPANASAGRRLRAEQGIVQRAPFGSHLHPIEDDSRVEFEHRGFVFRVRSAKGGQAVGKGLRFDRAPLLYIAGVSFFFLLLMAAFAYLAPAGSGLNVSALEEDTMLAQYLLEVKETKDDPIPAWVVGAGAMSTDMGVEGQASAGEEGRLGDESATREPKRAAVSGPENNPDPRLPPEQRHAQAQTAGILGALASLQLTTDGPTSPFAKQNAQGADPIAAMGALLGDVGKTWGFGGLGMDGTGRHGGGPGEGTIGMGNHDTIGFSSCGTSTCKGSGYAWTDSIDETRTSRVPKPKRGKVTVSGSLSKEAIRRTVRRHINEVRHCYERELRARPDLAGRVAIKFVIAPSGAVQAATVAQSSINDTNVEGCIATAVRRWGFPEPDNGGVVAVTYPFMLASH